MVGFALKAAVIDYDQLAARARHLSAVGLPLKLELHSFGPTDLYDPQGRQKCLNNLERLQSEFGPADLTFHIPFQNVKTVTTQDFDKEQISDSLSFAQECGSPRVVMHRYWGMVYGDNPPRSPRNEATEAFNQTVAELAISAPDITLLVENMGHYFLASRSAGDYLAGPLDHFFPWEIAEFRSDMKDQGIKNAVPIIDVAHATLSSNLFNHYKYNRGQIHDDPRYQGINNDDLDKVETLHPFDFVDDQMPWLHISDSHLVAQHDQEPLSQIYLTSEGLEIGTGSLPFDRLPNHINVETDDTVLLLEVEPGSGENHIENKAQCRSLDRIREVFG